MAVDPPQAPQISQSSQPSAFPMFYHPMGNFYGQQQPMSKPPLANSPFLKSEPMVDMAMTASTSSNSSRSTSPTVGSKLPSFSTLSMYGSGQIGQPQQVPNQMSSSMMPQMLQAFYPQNDFSQMMGAVPFGAQMGAPFPPMFDTRGQMGPMHNPHSHSSGHQRSTSLSSPLTPGFAAAFDPSKSSPSGSPSFDVKMSANSMSIDSADEEAADGKYVCPFENCGKRFKRNESLNDHCRIHTGEKPYKCPHEGCGKAYAHRSGYSAHLRVHSGVRPFACTWPECEKRFADGSQLRAHMRSHTGEKPYQCKICGKCFSVSPNLTKHLRTHNPGKHVRANSAPY